MLAGGQLPSIERKGMADMAGVVMAESPVLVAGRPVTLLPILLLFFLKYKDFASRHLCIGRLAHHTNGDPHPRVIG